MKTLLIISLIFMVSTSLFSQNATAKNATAKKVNEKEFEITNADSISYIEIELWLDNEYLGLSDFDIKQGSTLKHNINDWKQLEAEKRNIIIEKLVKHTYQPGDAIPKKGFSKMLYSSQSVGKSFRKLRIYLTEQAN